MEILIPITFFAMIAALVIAPRYFRSQERMRLQDTLRAAIEKGQPLPPEVVEALTSDAPAKRAPSAQRDLRKGVILLCVAAALVTMAYLVGMDEPDAYYPMIGAACFPGFIGLAFVAMSLLSKSKAE